MGGDTCVFFGIDVSVYLHLTTCSSKWVFELLEGLIAHEKISNNLSRNLGESKFGYLYFVYMWSVSGVKVEPEVISCQF